MPLSHKLIAKLILVFLGGFPSPGEAYEIEKNVSYEEISKSESLTMDIYRPSKTLQKKSPALIYTHGGCFTGGSKENIPEEVRLLADDGIVVFSIGYRLAPKFHYPIGLQDVQQAVRFIRQNAARFQIDAEKIASHGESAGGYLASALGLRSLPDRQGKQDAWSQPVQAVSNWYGRVDFTRPATATDCAKEWIGVERSPENMPRYKAASLIEDVSTKAANFHIMHGTHDPQVETLHSVLLANRLWNESRSARLVLSEGDGHSLSGPLPWELTRQFLLENLRPSVTPKNLSESQSSKLVVGQARLVPGQIQWAYRSTVGLHHLSLNWQGSLQAIRREPPQFTLEIPGRASGASSALSLPLLPLPPAKVDSQNRQLLLISKSGAFQITSPRGEKPSLQLSVLVRRQP